MFDLIVEFELANVCWVYIEKTNTFEDKTEYIMRNIVLFSVSFYTNADLKISLYVCVRIKTMPSKFRIPNPKNSRVIYA